MNWNNEIQLPSILSDISFAIQKKIDIDIVALAVNRPGSTDLSLSISVLNGEKKNLPVQTFPESTCQGFKIIDGHIFLQRQQANVHNVEPLDLLFQKEANIRIRSSVSFPIEHEVMGKGFFLMGSNRKELTFFNNSANDLNVNALIEESLLKASVDVAQKKYIIGANLYYQQIFRKSIIPTILFNQDGTIIAVNEAMETLYGYPISPQANQLNLEDLFPLPLQKKIIKYYRRYSSHQVHTMEIPLLRYNGVERIVELKMRSIDDKNQLMTASFNDITDDKIVSRHHKKEKDQLVIIHDLISSINSTLNKSQFTQVLFSHFKNFFDYSFIAIVLCDYDNMELDIHFSRETPNITVRKGFHRELLSFNELLSTCNQVDQNVELISKIETVLNIPAEKNFSAKLLIQFKTDKEIIGAMLLFRPEPMDVTDYDVRIFRDLSNYLADTLVRLNLIQKYQETLTNFSMLTQINEALNSSLDLEIMAKRIVESLQHVMQAKLCKICILEHERQVDSPNLVHELDPQIMTIAKTGRLKIFRDCNHAENQLYLPGMNFQQIGCHSILFLPIIQSRTLHALIFIFLDRPELVREYELDLLSMLAHHIALSMHNAKLLLRKGAGSPGAVA